MAPKSQIGLVGLAVMGENLALNIERNGFPITVYNRTWDKTEGINQGRKVADYVFTNAFAPKNRGKGK